MQQKQPRGTLPGPRKYAYTYEKNNDRIKLRQLLVGELEEEDVEETPKRRPGRQKGSIGTAKRATTDAIEVKHEMRRRISCTQAAQDAFCALVAEHLKKEEAQEQKEWDKEQAKLTVDLEEKLKFL